MSSDVYVWRVVFNWWYNSPASPDKEEHQNNKVELFTLSSDKLDWDQLEEKLKRKNRGMQTQRVELISIEPMYPLDIRPGHPINIDFNI